MASSLSTRLHPETPKLEVSCVQRWSCPQYLALLGVPVLAWEAWTVVAWLSDHPHVIRQFRDTNSTSWYGAHALEAVSVAVAIAVAIYVIRGCIRARRLTFDAMFCIAGLSMVWGDLGLNFFQPTFLYSSNFVNLNGMIGHMPLVVNPDGGRFADPILFSGTIEAFGLLGLAVVMDRPIHWARNRWPGISAAKLLGLILLAGLIVDIPLELIAIRLGLWTYTAPSWMSLPLGGGLRYSASELVAGPCFFALPIAIRAFKDDSGRTFVERGVQHLPPRRQKAVALLALYFTFQFIMWIPNNVPDIAYGPYESQWPKLPRHLVANVCDAPGIHGTRYGPCPGSPGYRMPVRGSLAGHSP